MLQVLIIMLTKCFLQGWSSPKHLAFELIKLSPISDGATKIISSIGRVKKLRHKTVAYFSEGHLLGSGQAGLELGRLKTFLCSVTVKWEELLLQ